MWQKSITQAETLPEVSPFEKATRRYCTTTYKPHRSKNSSRLFEENLYTNEASTWVTICSDLHQIEYAEMLPKGHSLK